MRRYYFRLPAIRRGEKFPVYDTSSHNLLLEYDYDEIVFDQDSEFQNVRIMHSLQFGNVLILDNDMSKLWDPRYREVLERCGQWAFRR